MAEKGSALAARRKAYTKLKKVGQDRPAHVAGVGNVLFKGFQCLAPECEEFIFVRLDQVGSDFAIACPRCDFVLRSDGETKFFGYELVHLESGDSIETGDFVILHDDYLVEAHLYKYCIVCYSMKSVESFDRHSSRRSGYQGECRLCKTIYNGIKNQSRITDQHREAAQRRRLYRQLAGQGGKIDSKIIFEKFEGRCFNCDRDLSAAESETGIYNLDHTLPARLLWPMCTDDATLLCGSCNNEKHDRWPSEYYDIPKLKRLARLTGFEYALLAGPPRLNDAAVQAILEAPDDFIEAWIHYPADIRKVRGLIRDLADVDIFEHAAHVPDHLYDDGEHSS